MTMILPPPRRTRRAVEENSITRPAIEAINSLPGCWAARNEAIPVQTGTGIVKRQPLGVGSSDILFSCLAYDIARIGWIETKQHSKRNRKDQEHQQAWADAMRAKGHFVALCTNVEQCLAAVERCRRGEFR